MKPIIACISALVLTSVFFSCGTTDAVDPFNPEAKALQRKAMLIYRTKPDSALSLLDKAGEIDPSFYIVHNSKAMILSNQKKFDKAVAELHHSLAINEQQPEALLEMGLLHERLAETNRASSYYKTALEGFKARQTGGGEFALHDDVNMTVAMFMLDDPNAVQRMKELFADNPNDPLLSYLCNSSPACFEGMSRVELLNRILEREVE